MNKVKIRNSNKFFRLLKQMLEMSHAMLSSRWKSKTKVRYLDVYLKHRQ